MSIRIRSGRIIADISFHQKEQAKDIGGWKWEGSSKWSWPVATKERVISIFPYMREDIEKELARYQESCRHMAQVKKEQLQEYQLNTAFFKRAPHEKQKIMIKNMIVDRKHALLCEVGTGKSQAVINTFETLRVDGLIDKCLIVCPKTVMDNWPDEIEINSNYSCVILQGTKEKRLKLIKENHEFYIINYAGLKTLRLYNHWDRFQMVVLDESDYIKNLSAKRTTSILYNYTYTKYKYILTGTAITESPLDIYPQFNFLDPAYLSNMSYSQFKHHYCIMGGYQNREVMGYKNMDELQRRIAWHSTQFKKEDCLNLPDKTYTRRNIELPDELAEQYKDMEEDFIMYSKKGILTADLIITKCLRMHQIISGAYMEDQKNNAKLMELKYLLETNLHSGNQIIIWCEFIPAIEMIKELLSKMGISYSQQYGQTNNRKEERDRFQAGETQVMLAQLTMGRGINLTAANIAIYYENDFALRVRIQTEGRNHRGGQTRKVTYIDLTYKGTIDEIILKAIKDKQDISSYLVKSFKPGNYEEGAVA